MMLNSIALGLMAMAFLCILIAFVRAALFASRHKHLLTGVVARSTWWMRLFTKNGYGEEVDAERRKLAWQLALSLATFFAIALYLRSTIQVG